MSLYKRIKDYFFNKTFIRYLLVGLLNTAFGVGMYCLFIYFGITYRLAVLLSTVLGVLFNFKTIGALVFKNKSNRLIFRFVLSYVVIYFVNIGLIRMFLYSSMINEYWAGILATPIVGVLSYIIQRAFVFNR